MTLYAVFALAVALSMDAMAVSVATGIRLGTVDHRQTFRLSFHFGLFQFLMPVLGWFLGLTVRDFIERWDHWVAFALLAFVGVNMLRESFSSEQSEKKDHSDSPATSNHNDPTRGLSLLMLSVATSIDALAVGLSFALLKMPVWLPAAIIGAVCALLSATGLFLGKTLSHADMLGKRAELLGGIVLLGIGLKILYEHGVFNG